jgi:hypothetical protein
LINCLVQVYGEKKRWKKKNWPYKCINFNLDRLLLTYFCINLQPTERYHFTIFHVERLACASSLFIETTNFQFITNPLDEPPRDYIISLDEDFHQNGIVAEVALSDIFSQGPPFDLSILRGIIYSLVYS